MATYSTNLALTLMATGEQSNTWGDTTNTNLGTLLEQAISGYVTQAITDGADTTITIPNGATGVARNMFLELTGALTATRNLIVPTNKKLYFVYNNTTGGFAVTVKVTGLTGVSVPNGKKVVLVSNGTDIVSAENYIASLSVGALTSGRVPYAGTSGLLQDAANLTFNGTTLTANTIGAFTLSGTVAGGGNQLNNVIIGTTTPLAGAFTTGTFSSTLGVTGVATLGNGAILGTPASGTVTNLTGTASININGTVGATTATTGAFTSLSSTIGANFATASGNVGIGTATPASKLTVVAATNAGIVVNDGTVNTIIYNSSGGISSIGTTSNHAVQLYSNNTPRATIDTAGNVGVGTSSVTSLRTRNFEVSSSGTNDGAAVIVNKRGTGVATLRLGTVGGATGFDVNFNFPNTGDLGFFDVAAATTRMVLDSSGNVGIGNSSPAGKLDITQATTNTSAIIVAHSGAGGGSNTNYGAQINVTGASNTNTGVYANAYGATNNYGVRIVNPPASATSWALYSDATAQSYFAGSVGIGTATPTLGVLQVANTTDATVAYFGILKNSGGSADGFIINDDRGFSGVNSGKTLRVITRNDALNDTGAIASFETTGGSTINALWVGISGNVGIGTTVPRTTLSVLQSGTANTTADTLGPAVFTGPTAGSYAGMLVVESNDAMAANIGGSIGFYGRNTTASTAGAYFSSIHGRKENGTSGDQAGYIAFKVRTTGNADNEVVRIASTGNVGIGTMTPAYKLEVSTDSAGKPGVGGLWTVVSDERIKSDIVPANLDRCYEIVKSVPLKHFGFAAGVYTDDQIQDKHNLGWIAQDVQKVFKNAVSVKPFTLKTDIPDGVEEYEEQDFTLETVEKTETSIQVINGKAVQVSKVVTSENKVMLFDTVDVVDEAGTAVLEEYEVTPAVPAVAATDGIEAVEATDETEAVEAVNAFDAVEAIPAVMGTRPVTYQMPRMITKTRPKVRHDVIEDCLDLNGAQMLAALYGAVQALMAKVETLENRLTLLEAK